MTVFGLMPTKNEASRYLWSCLEQVTPLVDKMFVFDDQSDDDGATQVEVFDSGATLVVRMDDEPSFVEHEGRFRQAAWEAFQEFMGPVDGDWVLAIDADEVLSTVGKPPTKDCLDRTIGIAEAGQAKSVLLPIPEVFGIAEDGIPLVRTDGLWGTIAGTRLFRYQPGGRFRDKAMGCGSEPDYVVTGKISREDCGLRLLHFGYADRRDQEAKYKRYTGVKSHGHLDAHVQSIVGEKVLERWTGPAVSLTREQ